MNYGADYGLMPSLFEPGGVVQHEFFVAGTPVIAFKTGMFLHYFIIIVNVVVSEFELININLGGLKDTVHEYLADTRTGNGYTFEAHTRGDFLYAFLFLYLLLLLLTLL